MRSVDDEAPHVAATTIASRRQKPELTHWRIGVVSQYAYATANMVAVMKA